MSSSSASATSPSLSTHDCGAVVVSYHPPPGFSSRLQALLAQVERVVVVDNAGSDPATTLLPMSASTARLQLIRNHHNLGIAAALNQGILQLHQQGLRWALLLDHDSYPAPDLVSRLLEVSIQDPTAIAWVPEVVYALPSIQCRWPVTAPTARYRFKRQTAQQLGGPAAVDLAISSGMLVDIDKCLTLGLFREDLFIDLVDTEFCLRARRAGFAIRAVPGARLQHALGEVREVRYGSLRMYPTHHAPLRHYFISRNRIELWREYARQFPAWSLYEAVSGIKLLIKVILCEPQKGAKLRATLQGTRDGLRRRLGGPPSATGDEAH